MWSFWRLGCELLVPARRRRNSKIRIHAFYCMLGISLLHYLLAEARKAIPQLSLDSLQDELRRIEQYVLLYPPQGEKGPPRTAIVQSKQTLTQQLLARTLNLDQFAKIR